MNATSETNGERYAPPPDTRSVYDRELPHSPDAERALLGSMLLDTRAIGEAVLALGECGATAYFFERHQLLHDFIVRLWNENRAIDGVVIKDELRRAGLHDTIGGLEFLGELISSVPSALRVREYAGIVREKHILRQLIGAMHKATDLAFDAKLAADEILDRVEQSIFDVTERRVGEATRAIGADIDAVIARYMSGEQITGEPTGFYAYDDITCGLVPSELIVVAGRPGMGKTTLGMCMAEHLAVVERRPVLFVSLEMSRGELTHRIMCSRAGVNSLKLRRGRCNAGELANLQEAGAAIRDAPLFVDDSPGMSILELRARVRMAKRRHGIVAAFVDYLQLMAGRGDTRQEEVAAISRGLKALAKELQIPVVALAQLNRKPDDRSDGRPRMSDLRESGAIEQDADVIALLHRDSYYTPDDQSKQHDAEVIIAKQRNGPTGKINLHFDRACTRFANPSGSHQRQGSF